MSQMNDVENIKPNKLLMISSIPYDQINEIDRQESAQTDLDILLKKYNQYDKNITTTTTTTTTTTSQGESNIVVEYGKPDQYNIVPLVSIHHRSDQQNNVNENDPFDSMMDEMIDAKNLIINDQKKEILKLKQNLVDLTLVYNTKIEQLKQEHKKELYYQYMEFMKRDL